MLSPRKVVAVVDDDLGMLKALKRLLSLHGFVAVAFGSAEAFLAHERIRDVHCLILDIHLGGISGIALKRQLAASGWQIPTIFMTAFDSEESMSEAMEAGCVAYLRKPFAGSLLMDAINQIPYAG